MAKCINSNEPEKHKAQKITLCDTIHVKFRCTQNYKIYSFY